MFAAAHLQAVDDIRLQAQYNCYGDCYSWSLDVARVPTEFTLHEDDVLVGIQQSTVKPSLTYPLLDRLSSSRLLLKPCDPSLS